jgi:hypothetical protein
MIEQLDLFGQSRSYVQRAPRHFPEPASGDIPFADRFGWQLADDERDAIARWAANWLAVGQPIKLIGGSPRLIGRKGRIFRLCSSINRDYIYVRLVRCGMEHDAKIVFAELRHIEPLGC